MYYRITSNAKCDICSETSAATTDFYLQQQQQQHVIEV
jgi:hypothetical protein